MTSPRTRLIIGAGAALALAGVLAGCTPSTTPTDGTDGQLELRVVSLLPGSEQAAFDAFDDLVAQFEDANPDIDVVPEEYEWTGPSFAARLEAGDLPDVFQIPFTDGKSLIQAGQLADITDLVEALPYAADLNPSVLDAGTGADGQIYALPYAGYAVGLHYNKDLFAQAGLDPENPPTTWAEVADAAAAIAAATGVNGYAQMGQGNTGGWQLTVATYARGGRIETENADGSVTATIDNPATKAALEFLHELRFTDGAMPGDVLFDWGTINQAFAAGQVGMYTSGADVYNSLVTANDLDPAVYGLTTIPLEGADAGVLGGGNLVAVNVKSDDAHQAAAMKWIDFYYMQKLIDQDAAVNNAATLAESDQPVGVPALPIFSKEQYDTSLEWIADYINVDQASVAPFTDHIFDQTLVPEPRLGTQEVYALLDTVVQAVLTDENADIDALLADANTQAQGIIDAAAVSLEAGE